MPLPPSARKRFLLVVPVFQAVYASPFANFLALALSAASKEHEGYEFAPYVPARQILHQAMNIAASVVLEEGFDGMIVCDDDCTPPFDAISRLLRHYEDGHPIVAGCGFMRNYPYTTTVGRYYPDGITLAPNSITGRIELSGFTWLDDLSREPEDLVPADFCGFPIVLMTADALRRISRPWFGTHINGGDCTHDVFFGVRAKDAKLPIMVDRTIGCGHLMDAQLVTPENRDMARALGTELRMQAEQRRLEAQAAPQS